MVLTRDVGGGSEGRSHLWVQVDAVVDGELGVALLLSGLDPALERLAALREEHVDDVLEEREQWLVRELN